MAAADGDLYESVWSSGSVLPLLADSNFGRGSTSLLVRLAQELLEDSTINARIERLFNHGIVSRDDMEVLNVLDNLSAEEWRCLAFKIQSAELIPGTPLNITMDLPMAQKQGQGNVSDAQRTIPASKDRTELRFNQIMDEQPLMPAVMLKRFTQVNGEMLRNLSLMPVDSGSHSVLARAYAYNTKTKVQDGVMLKMTRRDDSLSTRAALHEYSVLKALQSRPGIAQLYDQGKFETGHSTVVVLYLEANDSHTLDTLDVGGLLQVMDSVLSIVQDVHDHGLLHGNLLPCNILYDSVKNVLTLCSFQYTCIDPDASTELKERCSAQGISSQSPLQWKKSNLDALDTAPKNKRHDIFYLGVLLVSLLNRNTKLFLKRRDPDLSSLTNLDRDALNSLLQRGINVFSSFFSSKSRQDISWITELGQALLDPDSSSSCQDARAIIQRNRDSIGRQLPCVLVVPAKYVEQLGELQRCTQIFKRDCVDRNGDTVSGWGVRIYGRARKDDLLAPYLGQVHTKQHGDLLTAQGQGTNLKSITIGGQQMVLDGRDTNNGFCDIFLLAEKGHASKFNCNATVRVKRDGKGGNVVTMTRFPANAYFEMVQLSEPYRIPVPGNYIATQMIVARAARDLKDNEEIFVDYGPGTTSKMFGCCCGVISKSPTNKSADSGKKKRCIANK